MAPLQIRARDKIEFIVLIFQWVRFLSLILSVNLSQAKFGLVAIFLKIFCRILARISTTP